MARRRQKRSTRIQLVGAEMQFTMSDPNNTELVRTLDHYRTAVQDFRPVFAKFQKAHQRSILRNFKAEGRPKKWKALQPATIADRKRQGYGSGPILKRSGKLMNAFKFKWSKTQYKVWNTQGVIFDAHQFGYPPNNLPKRQMLVLLKQDQAQFTRLARKYLGFG
jgi:phage gpG-like protein